MIFNQCISTFKIIKRIMENKNCKYNEERYFWYINFYIAIDVKISTDKVLKKSKFKGVISPFASCKTKRAALSEVLDYNINLFETQYLKINKDIPLLTESSQPKSSNQIKKVKGGRSKKKTKKIRKIRKKLSKKKKFLNKNNIYKWTFL